MSRKRRHPPEKSVPWIENPWVRRAITAALLVHLTAMFTGPFQIATIRDGESSPFADTVSGALLPYIQLVSLDRGYQFFAPEPQATHLVRYEIEFDDGSDTIHGQFPNLQQQWPRLLYHRHMMLSEGLNALAPPPPQDISPQAWVESWPRVRDLDALTEEQRGPEDRCATAYADHLLQKYHGSRATLTLVRHRLVEIGQARDGMRLDTPDLYIDVVKFTRRASR